MTRALRKTLLLTTACCAGLVLAIPAALAQKEAGSLIQPKGGWAVTRIDDSNTQGGAYCTLARQFQNGVVFSIGRNKAEEYSIALDFQQSKLNADKAYEVTLKAGNQTRQLQMMPASARAMVIRLGWDDSFFAALEKSQTFTATLDKDSYAFSMPEYTKGKTELVTCMETLKTASTAGGKDVLAAEGGVGAAGFSATKTAQADQTPGAKPLPPTEIGKADPTKRPERTNIMELQTPEVAGLTSRDKAAYVAPQRSTDVATLEADNERLRNQLNEQRQSYEARIAQNNQGNRVAELEEKLRLAEQRGGAPAAAMTTAAPAAVVKADPAQAQKIAELEQKLAAANQQLNAKNDVSIKPATTPMPNPEQAKRIAELQDQVASLNTQLVTAKKAVVPVPAPIPAPLPVPVAAKGNADDAKKIAELQTKQQDYEARIAALQSQLANADKMAANAMATKSEAKPLPVAAKAVDVDSQRQIASLKSEVQTKDAQVRSTQQRIASYEREVSQLRQQIGQLQRGGAAPAATNTSALDRLKRENDTLRAQLNQQKDQYERRLASAQTQASQAASHTPRSPSALASVTPAAAPVEAVTSASIAPVAVASGGSGLKSVLSRAGITANAAGKTGGISEAYQWRSGVINGKAQAYQKGNAEAVSQQYAEAQRAACKGDFASVPGSAPSGRVSMDVACVDSNGAKAQSLLFAEQGGHVMAFILESSAEEMDQAMDARDKLNGSL